MDGSTSLQSILLGNNILVVDDNGVNRRVTASALKKYGAKLSPKWFIFIYKLVGIMFVSWLTYDNSRCNL